MVRLLLVKLSSLLMKPKSPLLFARNGPPCSQVYLTVRAERGDSPTAPSHNCVGLLTSVVTLRRVVLASRSQLPLTNSIRVERPTATSMRLLELRRHLPESYPEKCDRATMRHGLEARVPFLDVDLAGAALQAEALYRLLYLELWFQSASRDGAV
jgi:hypothetical protein